MHYFLLRHNFAFDFVEGEAISERYEGQSEDQQVAREGCYMSQHTTKESKV